MRISDWSSDVCSSDLTGSAPTDAPAMLVAAIVHADLITAAPFASHNGIVARAAERLVLVARGVDEKSLLVPEAGHLELRARSEERRVGQECVRKCRSRLSTHNANKNIKRTSTGNHK